MPLKRTTKVTAARAVKATAWPWMNATPENANPRCAVAGEDEAEHPVRPVDVAVLALRGQHVAPDSRQGQQPGRGNQQQQSSEQGWAQDRAQDQACREQDLHEMGEGRIDEGTRQRGGLGSQLAGAEGDRHEHQAEQSGRRRSHQNIEVLPGGGGRGKRSDGRHGTAVKPVRVSESTPAILKVTRRASHSSSPPPAVAGGRDRSRELPWRVRPA